MKQTSHALCLFLSVLSCVCIVRTLPASTKSIPTTPVMPPHPDSLSFYCRVRDKPAGSSAEQEEEAAAAAADGPSIVKLFDASWSPGPYDLSSLARLLGCIEVLFMRLLLSAEAGIHPSVRVRWEVSMRSRVIAEQLWSKGIEDVSRAAGGYITQDPTGSSLNQSPGRFQADYLSFYAQGADSHASIRRAQGFRADAPQLYAPQGAESNPLSPLLESMLRAGLLRFDASIDMLQRLHCLQSFMRLLHSPSARGLYIHLWAGVRIQIVEQSFEHEEDDFNYRYSAAEWQLPWNFHTDKLTRMIVQYLYAFHADNPQGLNMIAHTHASTTEESRGSSKRRNKKQQQQRADMEEH